MHKKTLIVVTGPTAVGKTGVALRLATFFQTEIISADSRQLFRELSIGTAVPSAGELLQAKHHFVHSHSIHDYYNASMFEMEVLSLLEELFRQHDFVVMAGGSMMYVDAVCKGIDDIPDVDPEIRQQLIEEYNQFGIEHLRLQLRRLDEAYYYKVDLKNPKRLLHALEICLMTGKPYSSFRTEKAKERPFQIVRIGLNIERTVLYGRINQRVDQMVEAGLEAEARTVYPFRHLNTLNTVGYKEWFDFFDGNISREEAVERIKNNSRRYARKQLTWFRRDQGMNWFEPHQAEEIIKFVQQKDQQ